jgi:uncharacterized protein
MPAVVDGRPALRAWLAKIVEWRAAPRWWLWALLTAVIAAVVGPQPARRNAIALDEKA